MKPKKNPKSDFNKKSLLFFQIGLIIVLFISWQAVEWKSYEKDSYEKKLVSIDNYIEAEPVIPKVVAFEEPKPIPKTEDTKEFIEDFIEDDNTKPEDIIETVKPTDKQPDTPAKVEDIIDAPVKPQAPIVVPFEFIENVPVYPGCEGLFNNDARKKCMSEQINKFVNRHFDKSLRDKLGLKGSSNIYLSFKINERGNVEDINANAPHPRLAKEAVRVMNLLPQMTPGKQRSKPVSVSYSFPIIFDVRD